MTATLLRCGEFPPTLGGEFERSALLTLRERLPQDCVLASNLSLPTAGGFFYELDVVVAGVDACLVLELKCMPSVVKVYEDCIKGLNEYTIDRVFSLLDMKAKVLKTRLKSAPFVPPVPAVETLVVVPDGARISFDFAMHKTNRKVMTLGACIDFLKTKFRPGGRGEAAKIVERWRRYTQEMAAPGIRTSHSIGRFRIKKALRDGGDVREYLAVDEPPCEVDVHLKEFAYDPLLDGAALQEQLTQLSREMLTLRTIRHPHIACVIGHFQTGASLVQVSDWFEGRTLDMMWGVLSETSLIDKVVLITKICDGLDFCHHRGIFHRDISCTSVSVAEDLSDLRLQGFAFARNLEFSRSLSQSELGKRSPGTVAPEELRDGSNANPRLVDVFQAGVLLYRLIENGEPPFDGSLDLATGGGIRPMSHHADDMGIERIRAVVLGMLSIAPGDRPQQMQQISAALRSAVAAK